MDNREGIQPESMKQPGNAAANGKPSDAIQEGAPPLPAQVPGPEFDQPEPEPGFFSSTNIVLLGLMAALAVFLFSKFNIEEMFNIVKAVLGLSFVIFIHELGHFLAAKSCNVNVTTFSIGFGPPIPGCWFRWGETTYKLAVLPLGGYVQMVGQVDGDEAADDDDDPRSYRRKTVAQRMLIISAGVIMNAILAVFCFIAVYMVWGREHPAAIISIEDSGGPVYRLRVPTGARILKIGNVDNPTFTDLRYTVIFSGQGDKIPFVYQLPGQEPVEIVLESRKDKNELIRAIGILSPNKLQLRSKRDSQEGPYEPGSPAAAAKFEPGDVIVAMTDPHDPKQAKDFRPDLISELPDDPNFPGKGQRDYFEFTRRLRLLADKDIVVRVKRGADDKAEFVNVPVATAYRIDFGARMQMGPIMVVCNGSPADKIVQAPDAEKKLEGDLIEAVTVKDVDGKEIVFKDKDLDPERLPIQLRKWSAGLDSKAERWVTLKLRRHVEPPGNQFKTVTEKLKWDNTRRFDRVAALSMNAPMAIPELGIAYQIKTVVEEPTRDDSPLKKGDVIKKVRMDFEGFKEDSKGSWGAEDIGEGQWASYSSLFTLDTRTIKKLVVKVERSDDKGEKTTSELEIPINIDKTWPLEERGWLLAGDTRRAKADTPWEAVEMGFTDTYHRMLEVFYTIRGIIRRDISPKVMGGPVTIAVGAYRFAGVDFGEFIFFLGVISINLAVVNFLPIPVLDGGHMVFLIYEKLRGKPASESVRIWATYAGLAVILCLMFFVLYLDINRFFLG